MLLVQDCHFAYNRDRLTKTADFNPRKKDWPRLPAASASELCYYINQNSRAFSVSLSPPVPVCVFLFFNGWLELSLVTNAFCNGTHDSLCPQITHPDFVFILVTAALLIVALRSALKHTVIWLGGLGSWTTEITSHAAGVCVLYLLSGKCWCKRERKF